MEHPDYDAFWKREAWVNQLHNSPVPNLNVAGFWDQEDPWGPWKIFRNSAESDPREIIDGGGTVVSRPMAVPECEGHWADLFGEHDTAREFRENIEAPFFRYYLHGKGEKLPWKVSTFESGANTWRQYDDLASEAIEAAQPVFSRRWHALLRRSRSQGRRISRNTFPIPPIRCPTASGRSRPPIPPAIGEPGKSPIRRFVDHRPDVLSFESAPLEGDLAVTGELAADLFASTSGTDSDFVVKLIDVFPENAKSLGGYQLPIAMEIRRGRYNKSYEHPAPLQSGKPTEYAIPLRDHDHVFLKGHRIMVQVQSSWFPVIDRNPQKFVPSIATAKVSDYVQATQRVYCSPRLPSHIVLPIVP